MLSLLNQMHILPSRLRLIRGSLSMTDRSILAEQLYRGLLFLLASETFI